MKIILCKTEKLEFDVFNELLDKVSKEKRESLLKNRESMSANTKLLSYICLRSYLCERLKLENSKLEFLKNENGKPYILNNPLYFNLAHTKDAFVIAFSRAELGIDIEGERKISEKIKAKYFTEKEKNEDDVLIWTKKEALVKLLGTGIKDISKADTNRNDVIFFTKESGNYKISCATEKFEETEFIEITTEEIIKEGILLEKI